VPRVATNNQRIEELEERVAKLEQRPARVGDGMTARDLNNSLTRDVKPLNDRIRALQAIVQAYETLLMAIFQAYGIEADQIARAVNMASQELTPDQQNVVRDLLRSV
jgi:hypothetical protein